MTEWLQLLLCLLVFFCHATNQTSCDVSEALLQTFLLLPNLLQVLCQVVVGRNA